MSKPLLSDDHTLHEGENTLSPGHASDTAYGDDEEDSYDGEYDLEAAAFEQEFMRNELRNLEKKKSRLILAYLIAGLLFISIIVGSSMWYGQRASAKRKRNVIFMISDGFGPASETYARTYFQSIQGEKPSFQLPLDTILVGASRTQSSSSLVTDSAAGATAFSCALKSYNGAIGVTPDHRPCGTVLEAAKGLGMKTGMVVTSRITHATPAAFSAHVAGREMEDHIAEQQVGEYILGRRVDLMMGGGRCFFRPNGTDHGCRNDTRDLWSEVIRKPDGSGGEWHGLTTRADFDSLDASTVALPLLGLFTPDHMSYEIDRQPAKEPALHEMVGKALEVLGAATRDTDAGFFLLIEGSRIDMAAHSNDPAAHVHEISAYQSAISTVKAYVDAHPESVMVSVSDHETGGFTLGRQVGPAYPEYLWRPEVIHRVQNSTFAVAAELLRMKGETARRAYLLNTLLPHSLGITNATEAELAYLVDSSRVAVDAEFFLGEMVSQRANLGWTTHGHSGVDVNLYAYGQDAEKLRGNHDNTEVGEFVVNFLGLDLAPLTRLLNDPKDGFWSESLSNRTGAIKDE